MSTVISIAVTLFFTFNALGNIPLFISLLRKYDKRRRLVITFRETLIALLLMLLFCFFGHQMLSGLGITITEVRMGGGVILFLIALSMMMPKLFTTSDDKEAPSIDNEPFIVPLAIPILTGAGTISSIMVFAAQAPMWTVVAAIFVAWIPSLLALLFCSYLQQLLGEKILVAMERLMGMILTLIALQMFSKGLIDFVHSLAAV